MFEYDAAMSLLDWTAGSSITVVEAGRRPAEMNESSLVKSVFVARPIGLNEQAVRIQPNNILEDITAYLM